MTIHKFGNRAESLQKDKIENFETEQETQVERRKQYVWLLPSW